MRTEFSSLRSTRTGRHAHAQRLTSRHSIVFFLGFVSSLRNSLTSGKNRTGPRCGTRSTFHSLEGFSGRPLLYSPFPACRVVPIKTPYFYPISPKCFRDHRTASGLKPQLTRRPPCSPTPSAQWPRLAPWPRRAPCSAAVAAPGLSPSRKATRSSSDASLCSKWASSSLNRSAHSSLGATAPAAATYAARMTALRTGTEQRPCALLGATA